MAQLSDVRERLAVGLDPLGTDHIAWSTGNDYVVHNPAGSCPATRSRTQVTVRDLALDTDVAGGRSLTGCPDCDGLWDVTERTAKEAMHAIAHHRAHLAGVAAGTLSEHDLFGARVLLEPQFAHGPDRDHPQQDTSLWGGIARVELIWQWWCTQLEDLADDLTAVLAKAQAAVAAPETSERRIVAVDCSSWPAVVPCAPQHVNVFATAESIGGADEGGYQFALLAVPQSLPLVTDAPYSQGFELGPDLGPGHRRLVRQAFTALAANQHVTQQHCTAIVAALAAD